MATDTNLTNLIINQLTTSQYNEALSAGTINDNELYLITDDNTLASKVYVDNAISAAIGTAIGGSY